MHKIKHLLSLVPFIFAWLIAIYCGFTVLQLLELRISSPWPHIASFIVTIGVFLLVNGFIFNRLLFKNIIERNTPILECNDIAGIITYPNEEPKKIIWNNVERIEIITTSDGPFNEDFWWLFYQNGINEPVDIPQGAKGNEAIFDILSTHFKGHNDDAIIKACGSTSENRFSVWQ